MAPFTTSVVPSPQSMVYVRTGSTPASATATVTTYAPGAPSVTVGVADDTVTVGATSVTGTWAAAVVSASAVRAVTVIGKTVPGFDPSGYRWVKTCEPVPLPGTVATVPSPQLTIHDVTTSPPGSVAVAVSVRVP